ncbi:hypothetical protein B0H13DRAFT_1608728 [Mycena leptocephala]|nr:hypothetical protein B0H13DRAFT_1608728 [Mycena leptocephala]
MQCATGAVLSGSAVTSLLHSGDPFELGDLDVFVQRSGGSVIVLFLQKAGQYDRIENTGEYTFANGVGRVWTLLRKDSGKKINVIESMTESPFDTIVQFHSTCVMGAWTARGVWHAYPALTIAGTTIATPDTMSIYPGILYAERTRKVLQKYIKRGYSFSLSEYDAPHVCGDDKNCPTTLRSTDDNGCMFMPFLPWDFSEDALAAPHDTVVPGG